MNPSLFVLSLPRSLSGHTYHAARAAFGLAEPVWTTDGEVLNSDRYAMFGAPATDIGRKFTRPDAEPDVAARLMSFLDLAVQSHGFAYKDVVQPFVVARWLAMRERGLRVLRIRRDLSEVALSMLMKHWLYPAGNEPVQDLEAAFLRGLMAAEAALDAVPAVEVRYEELVRDEGALTAALQQLAPGRTLHEIRYVDDRFRELTKQQTARKQSERYRLLCERIASLRAT
jgi:hypothetical protein